MPKSTKGGATWPRDVEASRPAASPRGSIPAPRARAYRVPEPAPEAPVRTRIGLLWLRTLQTVAGAITCAANAYFLFLYTTGRRMDDREFQLVANPIVLVGSGFTLVLAVLWLLLTLRPALRKAFSALCACSWMKPYSADLFWDVLLAIFWTVMVCVFSLHYPKTMPGIATASVHLVLAAVGIGCCTYMARNTTLDALVVAEVGPAGALANSRPRTGIPGMV